MSAAPSNDDDAFLAVVLQQRLADHAAGIAPTCADYQRRFPGREALVAALFAEGDSTSDTGRGLEPQRQIGPYHLVRLLGRGGQGEVWLADDPRLQRRVALKLVRSVVFADGDALVRFRREAEVTSRLDHPGICPLFDVGFTHGMPFLVMRHLEGESLAARLPALRPSGAPGDTANVQAQLRRLCGIVEKLARALHYAHEAGVLHRDLKPSNVIVTANDEPVLVDFGLARSTADPALCTRTGDLLGTPAYLAPELLDDGGIASRRSDIYALGALLHEGLTGARPFTAATLETLYRRILAGDAPAADVANPAVPRDLAVIAATAMAAEPARRYATAEMFADDLRRFVERRPILARSAGPWLRLRRWMQRNPALTAVAAALVIALGAALAAWRIARQEQRHGRQLLTEWERLADRRRLDQLTAAAATLWPAEPAQGRAYAEWLAQAQPLVDRLPAHRAALAELQRGEFDDAEAAWREQQLAELVARLEAFGAEDPYRGTIANVRARQQWAATVTALTIDAPAAAWTAAAERVRHAPRYHGLDLKPQVGLVPLGPDPASGLEEFAVPQTGAVPTRDDVGHLRQDENSAVVLVLLPAGRFLMGAQNDRPEEPNFDPECWVFERPPHAVELDAFLLAKYELTQAQWLRVMGNRPSRSAPGRVVRGVTVDGRHPVTNVNWYRCAEFARACGLELPTEAQWEYACRGGTSTPWATGATPESLIDFANLADGASAADFPDGLPTHEGWDDGHAIDAPVGSFRPNAFGLYDMHGNVSEWCREPLERYSEPTEPGTGERHVSTTTDELPGDHPASRVHRGGTAYSMASGLRAARRAFEAATAFSTTLGLRPSRPLWR